jgi:hypothetical protein
MADPPNVKKGDWIKIRSSKDTVGLDGYVFNVFSDGTLSVGSHQNELKAIKEDVI